MQALSFTKADEVQPQIVQLQDYFINADDTIDMVLPALEDYKTLGSVIAQRQGFSTLIIPGSSSAFLTWLSSGTCNEGCHVPAYTGLVFVHDQGVAHRRLNLETIMLSCPEWPPTLKIFDFSAATSVPFTQTSMQEHARGYYALDTFASGIIAWKCMMKNETSIWLLHGDTPSDDFDLPARFSAGPRQGLDAAALMNSILDYDRDDYAVYPTPNATDFVAEMLAVTGPKHDPTLSFTAPKALTRPWFGPGEYARSAAFKARKLQVGRKS
ncbi:hypothetical protein MKEN_00736400 [Mycena kentingensis (nom. inval.)]|nr:hypothetical protein MKEN_00736400 [Mycena kentingensis (nom. inval.)]